MNDDSPQVAAPLQWSNLEGADLSGAYLSSSNFDAYVAENGMVRVNL